MLAYLNHAAFGIFPYIALATFLIGSLIRFDREQYSWRSGSSQMLRKRQLRWGSNLFHIGILFLLLGHFVGLLTPHWAYEPFIGAGAKQMLAIVAGGVAGAMCFVGLSLLIHRRLFDSRIRKTSSVMDIAILLMLWAQLVLGLITIPYSLEHRDGSVMLALSEWAQRIVTFQGGASDMVAAVAWPYKLHIWLGLLIFFVYPFRRPVHHRPAPLGYVVRAPQAARRRRAAAAARAK